MTTSAFPEKRSRLDLGFLALLALVVAANWLVEPKVVQNDTSAALQQFFCIYNEFFFHGELQGWDPFYFFGVATDVRLLTAMSCPLYFTAVAGKLLHVRDAFTLFKCGLVLEQILLTTGVYLLGQSLYRHRRAALFTALCAALSAVWIIQVWFNFRNYALMPFVLFFGVEFFRKQKPSLLFAAGVVFVLSQLGSPGYFAPVQVLVLTVFLGLLALTRRARGLPVLPGPGAWLAPGSLAWLAVLTVIGLSFVSFCTTLLHYDVMAGYGGRDPLTGKATLHNYLTVLDDPAKAFSSLWELVYAAPRDWIFTLYAGLFAVPFALYGLALRRHHQSPALAPTLAALGACLALALGQATFVAPLAYHVFPLMDRTRYLLAQLALVKFFLILLAGFGADLFLDALAGEADESRRRVRLAAWLCAGVCAAVLVVDLTYGISHGYPYAAQLLPYAFHFLPLGLLGGFALYLFTTDQARTRAFAWLFGLAGTDLASYAFLLVFSFLPTPPAGAPGHTGDAPLTERQFRQGLEEMRQAFLVRPSVYQQTRFPSAQLAMRDPLSARRLAYYNLEYGDLFNFLFLDVCDPTPRAPVTHINTGLVRFTHAKLGLDLDESLHLDNPWIMNRVLSPWRYVGCGTPKAFLAADVFKADSPAQAAAYLAEVGDADVRPVVLPAEPYYAPLTETQRRLRPTVLLCPREGLCQEADPGDPAFWDAARAAFPDFRRTVFYTYPQPKTVVKYRLGPDKPADAPLMPRTWTLSGSNDGRHWTVLDRRDDVPAWEPSGHRDFVLSAPAAYRYYVFDAERAGEGGRFSLGALSLLAFGDLAPPDRKALPVTVENFRANGVTMRADVPPGEPRWLVYLDNADPGWTVLVDGHSAPLYLANLAFKAVRLDPGSHTVVFDYRGKGKSRLVGWEFLVCATLFTLWGLWLTAALAFPALPRPCPRTPRNR